MVKIRSIFVSRLIGLVALAFCVSIVVPALAASGNATGSVRRVQLYTYYGGPGAGSPAWQIQLTTTADHGSCPKVSNRTVFAVAGPTEAHRQQIISMATAAMLSGKEISITWNDANKHGGTGYCSIEQVQLIN